VSVAPTPTESNRSKIARRRRYAKPCHPKRLSGNWRLVFAFEASNAANVDLVNYLRTQFLSPLDSFDLGLMQGEPTTIRIRPPFSTRPSIPRASGASAEVEKQPVSPIIANGAC
jgi:hypothetical protein